MAKSKYAPALFEVINRQRNTNKLDVPKWWKGIGRGGSTPPASQTPPATDAPIPTSGKTESCPDDGQPAESLAPDCGQTTGDLGAVAMEPELQTAPSSQSQVQGDEQPRQPAVQVEAGRVWISLSTAQAVLVACVMIGMIGGSFSLGRMSKSGVSLTPGNGDELTKMLAEAPDSSVLKASQSSAGAGAEKRTTRSADTVGTGSSAKSATAADEDVLKGGLCYVLLDTYSRSDRASAEHVQKWLATTHNIPTVLRQTEKEKSYLLIATAGFDWSNPTEREKCNQLAGHIKSLGRDCKRELIRANLRVYGLTSPQVFQKKK